MEANRRRSLLGLEGLSGSSLSDSNPDCSQSVSPLGPDPLRSA
jgi:hypothetical protein